MSQTVTPSADDADATLLGLLRLLATDRATAAERLVAWFLDRYPPLARWLLRGAPAVARFELSGDLLGEAAVRLHRALSDPTCTPADPKHFHNLCVLQLKRQLGDFKDKHTGPHGLARHYLTPDVPGSGGPSGPLDNLGSLTHDAASLVDWTLLHQQIAALPTPQRTVFELCYYDGLTQQQAADRLAIPLSQVKRAWRAALLRVQEALGGEPDTLPPA